MILELFIQNVAVIEKLNISFKHGMSVLTGETGAGKSIIIDSINLILGNKADKSLIRFGEEKAEVSAVFDINSELLGVLEEKGIECEDNSLIITRTLSLDGKSISRINGTPYPLSFVREISPYLINIHGQHDNQALLNPSKHIRFLDEYADLDGILSEYKVLYSNLRDAKSRLEALVMDDDTRIRRLDLLKYQIEEIETADLKDGEEDELLRKRDMIQNAEKIISAVSEVKENLYSDDGKCAYNGIYSAISALERISGLDEKIDEAHGRLTDMLYSVQDIAYEVSAFGEDREYNENTLNDIEDRLDTYSKLKRKYGKTVLEINEFYEKISEELNSLQSIDENIEKTKAEILKIEQDMEISAKELTGIRKKTGVILQEKIEQALNELNMEQARFEVGVYETEDFQPDGKDRVEFLISANAGEPLKPLVKIASGGELSRVMLAMKSILSECDSVDTLIFDEIDTGVSGSAAQKIADKLSKISKSKQVISITHHPSLASISDNHYFIEKNTVDGKTKTNVKLLDFDERVLEIARITGGEISEISKEHALELIKKAEIRKCKEREQ